MRITITEVEKQRSLDCGCLHNSIVVESLVIALTLVSGLAITGENLFTFDLITVPKYVSVDSDNTSIHHGTNSNAESPILIENDNAKDIANKVFHYTSLAIAALFFLEIFLKVCTFQKKCIINPWQIFDVAVVLVTLTLELAFHFLVFHEKGLYSLTYTVMLRLWRVPMVCNIRTSEILESRDNDIEIYRSGRLKAETTCSVLEDKLTEKNETIKRLEGMLQHLSGSKLSDVESSSYSIKKNGHLFYVAQNADGASKSSPKFMTETFSDLSFSQNPEKQSKSRSSDTLEPRHNETSQVTSKTYTTKRLSHHEITEDAARTSDKRSEVSGKIDYTEGTVKSSSDSTDGPVKIVTGDRMKVTAETSFTLLEPPSQSSRILMRSRKRRSSANEIIDYSSLNSPRKESMFYENPQKSSSCHSLDLEKDNLFTKDIYDKNFSDKDNSLNKEAEKNVNFLSDSTNKLASLSLGTSQSKRDRKRPRRFASCPEYVFTQRMSITNDESRLIEDGHAIEHSMTYKNPGFDNDETVFLEVMAEFDGTKTYRNEDGIPMTSL